MMTFKNPKPVLFDDNPIPEQKVAPTAKDISYRYSPEIYFAYIDVLGFKQTYDENSGKSTANFALKYRNTFQYFANLMNTTVFSSLEQQHAGQTSDSLYFYTSRIDHLALFIKLYTHFSLYAMSENVFFRGGIAKGSLFIDAPHQFYGDSVINAYLLEENIAKLPRVVIDNDTFTALQKVSEADGLIVNEGDRNYIKPFIYIPTIELQNTFGYPENLLFSITTEEWKKIGRNIRSNRKRFEFDENNYSKYCYLLSEYEKVNAKPFIPKDL